MVNVRKVDYLDINWFYIGLDFFQCVFKQFSFFVVNEFIGVYLICEMIKGVSNFLLQVGVGDVVYVFMVGLENGCNFGWINFVCDFDVVVDGGFIVYLEVESVFICFYLFEGWKDINFGILVGLVVVDVDDFINVFIVV